MKRRIRAALALGSGGARGYAHIGAIEVLEERGFEIVTVAGASMGALVGGLYAAGKLDGYTDWVCSLTHLDMLRLMDVSFGSSGVIRAEKILARVRELIEGAQIEDLAVPFTAVATDLFARKEVWFQRGPLEVALRASIAIPGVFTPVMLNGRLLVDGGLLDPIPIAPTMSARAEVTIAVDLGGDPAGLSEGAPATETAEERPVDEWVDRFRRGTSHLLDRDPVRSLMSRFGGTSPVLEGLDPVASNPETFESLPAGLGKFEVMNQSVQTMQSVLKRYRLAGNPPDVLVTVPRDSCRTLDFHRAADMIALGRALTIESLDCTPLPGIAR